MPDSSVQSAVGMVYLIGAGPGDPGLLTLRGAACLRRAHVVLYDYLVNPVIVRYAGDTAEKSVWDNTANHASGRRTRSTASWLTALAREELSSD